MLSVALIHRLPFANNAMLENNQVSYAFLAAEVVPCVTHICNGEDNVLLIGVFGKRFILLDTINSLVFMSFFCKKEATIF